MNKSDHKVTIHHIPTNTTPITSDGSQSCRAAHEIIVLKNKGERIPSRYYYGPVVQGELLTHRHGGSKVDEDCSGGGSTSRTSRKKPSSGVWTWPLVACY